MFDHDPAQESKPPVTPPSSKPAVVRTLEQMGMPDPRNFEGEIQVVGRTVQIQDIPRRGPNYKGIDVVPNRIWEMKDGAKAQQEAIKFARGLSSVIDEYNKKYPDHPIKNYLSKENLSDKASLLDIHGALAKTLAEVIVRNFESQGVSREELKSFKIQLSNGSQVSVALVRADGSVETDPTKLIGPRHPNGRYYRFVGNDRNSTDPRDGILEKVTAQNWYTVTGILMPNTRNSCPEQTGDEIKKWIPKWPVRTPIVPTTTQLKPPTNVTVNISPVQVNVTIPGVSRTPSSFHPARDITLSEGKSESPFVLGIRDPAGPISIARVGFNFETKRVCCPKKGGEAGNGDSGHVGGGGSGNTNEGWCPPKGGGGEGGGGSGGGGFIGG